MKYEQVIKGNIVLETEVVQGSIGIIDGEISKISRNEDLEGEHVKDFGYKLIFPGAIDVHVHCFSNPNEGFEKTTRLGARGGVTTFLDMPYDLPNPVNNVEIFMEKAEKLEKEAIVDIGLWGTIPKRDGTSALKPLLEAGAMSFKMSTYETDEYRFPKISNADIIKAMKILAGTGIVLAFHSEDDEIVKSMVEEYQKEGKHYNLAHAESRPPYTETAAVLQLMEFAYWTGAKIHIVHASHPRTFDLIKTFKEMGVDVTAETCYTYLLFDLEDLDKQGPAAKMNPPLRTKEEVEGMWKHVKEGNIDLISSDHIVWEEADKNKGYGNIFNAPSGLPGLEVIVHLMFDAMVSRHNLSPVHFAKMMSTNAAERFGIPGKGKIKEGFDADFVVIDPELEWTMGQDALETNINLLPIKGRNVKGKIMETIVRGKTVFDGEKVTVQPGYGKFIKGSRV
jgi:allantoinase